MQIEETAVAISTPDGSMPAFLYKSTEGGQKPAMLLLMEAFGLTPHIRDVATRIASKGYVVLTPEVAKIRFIHPHPGCNVHPINKNSQAGLLFEADTCV